MSVMSDGPVHTRARYRRPSFVWTTAADRRWRPLVILRSSCGHALGLAGVLGNRQWALQWKTCR